MNRFGGHIERRLFNAVLLVLGACGGPAKQQETNDTNTVATGDAKELCDAHKQSASIDRSKGKQAKPSGGFGIYDKAYWDPGKGVAVCTIVRERVPGKVTIMYSPHWCPQGGGEPPKPMPREVQGEKIYVERAILRGDGSLVTSEVEWTPAWMDDEPRHNCGRRFEGLALEVVAGDDPGAQLAAMAELEAASVPAFDRLARELAAWGAPADLVQRARLAMRDEVRHARVMSALALEYGHTPRAIDVPALPCRSLEAIALENAIEGCVREAYGALVATYQAERARPALRAVFRAIADDERAHAQLAEDVHAWILDQLDADPRAKIEQARLRAVLALRTGVASSRECNELGLPSSRDAIALCDAYFT